jgi:hypothetical protein
LRGCARGFKQHHIDGEALALHAHLKREGYECVFLDAYYRAVRRWWLMPAARCVRRRSPPRRG